MPVVNPAELIVCLFGGVRMLARAVGRDVAAVSRWRKRGRVPGAMYIAILSAAKQRGIELDSGDLIFGRDEST